MKAKEEILNLLVAEVKKMIEKNYDGHFTYWLAVGSKMNYESNNTGPMPK